MDGHPPGARNAVMRLIRQKPLPLVFLLLLCLASATAQAEAARVVATIPPIHSLVAGVTRGVSEPYALIRGGQSPHGYALTTADARALNRAAAVFAAGERIEAFLGRAARSLPSDVEIVWMNRIDGLTLHPSRDGGAWGGHDEGAHADHGGDSDDHVWLDPHNAMVFTRHAADLLARIDADHAEAYRANARRQIERLERLDARLRRRLEPIADVPYLVFHDAYQYFERRYGLNAVGAATVDPKRTPGARRLHELGERIEAQAVDCMFAEPQFEPRVIRVIERETAIRTGELDPLGADLEPGPDAYFELLDNLARGLEACLRADD